MPLAAPPDLEAALEGAPVLEAAAAAAALKEREEDEEASDALRRELRREAEAEAEAEAGPILFIPRDDEEEEVDAAVVSIVEDTRWAAAPVMFIGEGGHTHTQLACKKSAVLRAACEWPGVCVKGARGRDGVRRQQRQGVVDVINK